MTYTVSGKAARRWRHKKRGTTYTEVGRAKLQAHDVGGFRDYEPMVVYRSEDDGQLWCRPEDEFDAGRFEELPALASQQSTDADVMSEAVKLMQDRADAALRDEEFEVISSPAIAALQSALASCDAEIAEIAELREALKNIQAVISNPFECAVRRLIQVKDIIGRAKAWRI